MFARSALYAVAALLLALPSLAAPTVAERSPFAQGHWWNPQRSGNGFEIFNAAGQVAVVWYTFEASGKPVWYTAQGDQSTLGTSAWPLMRHKWSGNGISQSTQVGSLKLDVKHPEAMQVEWQVGATQGSWAIQPLLFSGVVNEVDHSGSWFAPANGGWGVTVSEQGDVLGGAVFTYDAAGDPTWVAGFQRGSGTVEYFSCTGACPSCTYTQTVTTSAGRLTFDFAAENRLTLRENLNFAKPAGVNMDRAQMQPLSRPASWRAADRQLANFGDEAALKTYLSQSLMNMPPNIGTDFSPAPVASAFSQTNLQESAVDEADLVKTDGRFIYTFATDANGARLPVIRIAEVGDGGATLTARGQVDLADGWTGYGAMSPGLYLHGNSLVSIASKEAVGCTVCFSTLPQPWMNGVTVVEVMSRANPAAPVSQWRVKIDGYLMSSRRIGDRLYVITRFTPAVPGFVGGATTDALIAANTARLQATSLEVMLPRVSVNGGPNTNVLSPADVFVPPQGTRLPQAEMLMVTAIDLAGPRIAQSLALLGRAEVMYVSAENLYLALGRYEFRDARRQLISGDPLFAVTDVHRIALGAQAMAVDGSGSVEGVLVNDTYEGSFRISEHAGRIRLLTFSGSVWGTSVKNRLTILERSTLVPGLLKTLSYLPNPARPDPIGKPGESITSARFSGDRLYTSTFRRIDPLYVVDLSNAADPRVTGSLEVTGIPQYLHALPNGLLLGFGLETNAQGRAEGLQLSLFDVRDASNPRQLQRMTFGAAGSGSSLFMSHHAFASLGRTDGTFEIAIPARLTEGSPDISGMAPWKQSGVVRYDVRTASGASLVEKPMLVTHAAPLTPLAQSVDPAVFGGRSIIFPNGVVFVGNGKMWLMGADNVTRGSF